MILSRRTFLQQLSLGASAIAVAPGWPRALAANAATLLRSTPEAEGISSAGILTFLRAIPANHHELHSFMMLRHGKVVAEGWWSPYAAARPHTMYSMSKSFTSTAVGFAVAEGKLKVDDLVTSFFPQDVPKEISPNLAALKVKHLLTMSVGNEKEPTGDVVKTDNWVRTFLTAPITHEPGSVFMYNSAATYMCSAIVQQVTGQKIVDYLRPRLFDPLGVEKATWETCPRGINTGGWGLSVATETLARFGQLYLQKGQWQGRQILPAAWVEEATTFKIQQPPIAKATRPAAENDWQQGYGYQFWRCRHGAFRGDGAFGQYTIVMPEQDVVIAMTGESSNMQGELDLVWEHLLPAIQSTPLPAAPESQTELQKALAGLQLPPPKATKTNADGESVAGKSYHLAANGLELEQVRFEFAPDGITLHARDGKAVYAIAAGREAWKLGETALPGTPPRLISGGAPARGTAHAVAASATWSDAHTLEFTCRYIETPHHDTITCSFDGSKVALSFASSISQMSGKGKDSRPKLEGEIRG